jgi:predicted dehydrogenase
MNFCLIGCGDIANTMHAPAFERYHQKHPDFHLTACCDPRSERAAAMQKLLGFERYYLDYKEMLLREKPDAVAVTVSETASVNVGVDVMRAGIPMLIEKPPGRLSSDTARLIAQAQSQGVPCQVAFNRRYMPVLSAMRALAPENIQLVTYDMIRCERRDRNFANTAVHAIDAVRFLADADYRYVRFTYLEMPEYGEGVCNVFMDCLMTSGTQAQIRICPMSGASLERAAIHAKGRMLLGYTPVWGGYDAPGRIEDFRDGKEPVVTAFDPCDVYQSNGFLAEDEAFFDALKAGKKPIPDIASAMNTMLVKECIDQRQEEFRMDQMSSLER